MLLSRRYYSSRLLASLLPGVKTFKLLRPCITELDQFLKKPENSVPPIELWTAEILKNLYGPVLFFSTIKWHLVLQVKKNPRCVSKNRL